MTWQQTQKPLTTLTLAEAFSGMAAYALLKVLEDSLYPDLKFVIVPLQSVAVALAAVCLIQFAYHFPVLYAKRHGEARIVFWLSLSFLLWEIYYTIYRYDKLAHGIVEFRPTEADIFVAGAFLWLFVVLIRQVARADERSVSLWRKLWKTQGDPACAARAFLGVSLFPLWSLTIIILHNQDLLPTSLAAILLSLGLLFGLLFLGLTYLNYLPETTSFMVKLVAISLAVVLGILGTIGHLVSPAFVAGYQPPHFIADHQTIRFTPNDLGGYDIAAVPFQFQTDLGARLDYDDQWVPLAFTFPFYGQEWEAAYLLMDGEWRVADGESCDVL